jgi:hypothetical protein
MVASSSFSSSYLVSISSIPWSIEFLNTCTKLFVKGANLLGSTNISSPFTPNGLIGFSNCSESLSIKCYFITISKEIFS